MTNEFINSENDMKLYQSGDMDAFARIYNTYSSLVYGFLKKKLPTEDLDDLFQNVWIHLHEKKHLYQNQPFAPWFFFMIKNLIVDFYRSKSSRTKTLERLYDSLIQDEEFQSLDLNEMLESLPTESQELIRKYYLEGQEYADLEKEMKVSQTGLRKRLSRAISSLRKHGRTGES